MTPLFGRPVPELCMITNHVMNYNYDVYSHRITEWNNHPLRPHHLEVYAEAFQRKGATLPK